jgi:hypothetical protein
MGVVVDDDRVGDPKAEDDVLGKAYCLFGAYFSHGPILDPLSELVDYDKQMGEAPERHFFGSQEVQASHGKGPCDGDGLELSSWHVDLPHKVLAPFARLHNLNRIGDGCWPVKTLPKGFTDHAPL